MGKSMKLYPLKSRPIFKERIWGGRRLAELFGKPLPAGRKIGESWELADLPTDKTFVAEGELAGMTIGGIANRYPAEVMGRRDFIGPFPLLLKFLDAHDVLSVQVHPDQETCRRMGRGQPKTECWYIVAAQPGAVIYKGVRRGLTVKEMQTALNRGAVAEVLNCVEVAAGECHILPAGTPHAIGAGIVLAEIQTPSDTTYRLFDWGRLDDEGRPRQLHIAEALESIILREADLPVTTEGRLVDTEFFKVEQVRRAQGTEDVLSGTMKVLMVLKGRGRIFAAGMPAVDFVAGDTLLIPAALEGRRVFDADAECLETTL